MSDEGILIADYRSLKEPCNMSLSELMAVVSPPQNPIEIGNESQLVAIEEKMGTRLPDDYRAFAEKFGTGRFTDSDWFCISKSSGSEFFSKRAIVIRKA